MSHPHYFEDGCFGAQSCVDIENNFKKYEARVKELEMEHAIWEKHSLCELVKDNARLRKVVDRLQGMLPSYGVLVEGRCLRTELDKVLRELDGEKKSSPGCTCQEWSGALCGHCQKVHKI